MLNLHPVIGLCVLFFEVVFRNVAAKVIHVAVDDLLIKL